MRICGIAGCARKHYGLGLCRSHYGRRRAGRDMSAPIAPRRVGAVCAVAGCGRKHKGRGLCQIHLKRRRRGDEDWDRPVHPPASNPELCTYPGCGRLTASAALCQTHYKQSRAGAVLSPITPKFADELTALVERLDFVGGHWLWTGAVNEGGYGIVSRGLAHRRAYELFVGPLPDYKTTGITVDHLCAEKMCCRPDHLDPVPHIVNVRRGGEPHLEAVRAS